MYKATPFYLLFLLLSLLACQGTEPHQQADSVKTPMPNKQYDFKLICIGDATLVDDEKVAFPARLEQALSAQQPDKKIKIVNAAMEGETIAGIHQRIAWMLQQRFDAILIALNKIEQKQAWQETITKIKQADPASRIFLAKIDTLITAPEQQFLQSLSDQYACEWLDLTLAPNEWQTRQPNEQGHQRIAKKIFNSLSQTDNK